MTSDTLVLSEALSAAWMPPPQESVVEWCETNIFLPPQASPRPGRYSTDITPYVRPILNIMDDTETEIIVAIFAAQTSKTMMMLAALCYVIGKNPTNAIWMMPSTDLAQSFSETRLDPIIENSPALKKKKPLDKDKYKKLEKHFADMTLNLIGGNSPTQLASRSAGYIFADEIDKLMATLGKEANPIELLMERMKWYVGRNKAFLSTTPTTREHMGWSWLERGTYERLYWPCPHCTKFFVPDWKMVKWDKSEGMTDEARAKDAYIECPSCQGKFVERHKRRALQVAEWRQTNFEVEGKRIRSFHLSEIQSGISPLKNMVIKFLAAVRQAKKGDLGALQNFVNSSLAEPWEAGSYGKRNAEELRQLTDSRDRGIVPDDATGLVFGADTQDNGFWYGVYAFGVNKAAWLVQEGFVDSLRALEEVMWEREWKNQSGLPVVMNLGMIDSGGHRMEEVNAWCLEMGEGRVMPILGRNRMQNPYTLRNINDKGYGGQRRFFIHVDYYKDILSQRLKMSVDSPGAFRLYRETPLSYMNQMTTEYKDERGLWVCPKHHDNHLWDCTVYAWCAADFLQLWDWQDGPKEPVIIEDSRTDPSADGDGMGKGFWHRT